MRHLVRLSVIAMLVAAIGLTAGCGSKTSPDTQSPAKPTVGVLDVAKVINSHPKNAQLKQLEQEYNTLAAEVEAEKGRALRQAGANSPEALNSGAGLADAANQEFNDKITAKQKELNEQLNSAAGDVKKSMTDQLTAYANDLDKDYEPEIFSLQLKLKTVQLTKDAAAATQAQIDSLQKERAGKIAAKQQELSHQMDQIMSQKQTDAKSQLDAYAQETHQEIAKDLSAKQAELVARMNAASALNNIGQRSEKEQQLVMKQQEINALKEGIINDVRDKAGKVAAENGLEIVLANAKTNINAQDVTDAVIAECNK